MTNEKYNEVVYNPTRQKDQSKYMQGRQMQSNSKATIWSIVTLEIDYRDVSNLHGITAIVFAQSTNEPGQGIQAVRWLIMALYVLER